ncbi:mitochondrial inner membrane protein required for protein import [Cryomyces antarcticus]|nr:mitochondrial inner membrane protein required for protein import [Cryomyces antarcticus]
MLSRAAARPASSYASRRIATSSSSFISYRTLTRNLTQSSVRASPPKDNRPHRPPKKPAQFNTVPNSSARPSTSSEDSSVGDHTWKPRDGVKFGGAAAAGTAGAVGADRPRVDKPEDGSHVGAQIELDPPATPIEMDLPETSAGNSGPAKASEAGPDVINLGAPPASSPPDSRTSSTAAREVEQEAAAEAEAQSAQDAPSQPLPDLRQGIPSTFDFEFGKGSSTFAKSGDQSGPASLDVTEENAARQQTEAGGRGGRNKGDYPKSAYESSLDRRRNRMANYMYLALLGGLVGTAGYLGRPFSEDEKVPDNFEPAQVSSWSPAATYSRISARMNSQMGYYTEPAFPKLLPDMDPNMRPPYTLVLSLEDLLVHSEWSREHGWRLAKRPGVDYFLRYLSQYYELVIFTSVSFQSADPIIRKLDPFHIVMWPLFREATRYEKGEYIKDLSYLNRPLSKTIVIDTNATHAKLQPENAIILPKWKGDPKDPHAKDLVSLIPFLEYVGSMGIEDTRKVLESFKDKDIPAEFAAREAKAREAFNKQLAEEKAKRPKRSLGSLFGNALGIKAQPGMGSLTLDGETSAAQGFEEGKMLSDQIRERGQREYERMEKEIRENGAKWLAEMAAEEKKAQEEGMKSMRAGLMGGWFGGGQPKA